jgi:hypothetical protein
MVCGAMPRFRRWGHLVACGFMCLLFTGLCVLAGAVFITAFVGAVSNPGACLVLSFPFALFAVWAIVSMVRGLRTQVREFSYDGRLLRFRTLTRSTEQIRDRHEITEIRRFEGRGGSCGYCLRFRDDQKICFDYSLQVEVMVDQLSVALMQVSMPTTAAATQGNECGSNATPQA